MKQKNLAKMIALGTASAALIVTMGVGVFAANGENETPLTSGKMKVMEILTDEQKEELTKAAKESLAAELADGRITQAQYEDRLQHLEDGVLIGGGPGGPRWEIEKGEGGDFLGQDSEMQRKFDALTDAQKQELQELADQKLALELQTIDKQVSFGLLDSETAKTMKEDLKTMHETMKESGHYGFGIRMHRFTEDLPAEISDSNN